MSAKLYEDVGYHYSTIQAITFLGNRPSFEKFVPA